MNLDKYLNINYSFQVIYIYFVKIVILTKMYMIITVVMKFIPGHTHLLCQYCNLNFGKVNVYDNYSW